MLTDAEELRLLDELQEKRKRQAVKDSLVEFARAAGFEPAPHHRLLIRELEALERGEMEVLVVEMPPGSAKSTYVNFLFPAWCLSRVPSMSVLTASHSAEMAERWGRRTRNLITSTPTLEVELDATSQAAYRWATASGGEYYAAGAGVGIAGIRADLGIIDDPFGSRADAESPVVRQSRWDWYLNDFNPRLKPGARRVIMHTRWHDDDLAGRVKRQLAELGRRHSVLTLPAEALPGDALGRQPGEMLWDDPGGYDYGSYLRDRKAESDPRTWASLYQQNPVPDEGGYFKAEWLQSVQMTPPREQMKIYGGSDYAVTANGGDYTVHAVLGVDYDGNPYLLDLWRRQAASDEWVDAWCDLVHRWKPLEWAEEQGQIRAGVGPFLDRRARDRRAHCARSQFPTRGDKAVRAQSFRGLIATRGLRIPMAAPWRNDVTAELLRFPAGVHDDIVDALGLIGQLLERIMAPRRPELVKPKPPRLDWFEEREDAHESWKVA